MTGRCPLLSRYALRGVARLRASLRPALATLFAAFAFALPPAAGQGTSPSAKAPASGPRVVGITFKGPIKRGDVERLRQAIALADAEPLPARLVVFLDSGGGDGLAAMEMGRVLRHARAHVFVTGRCASACVFAYVGGVYRDAVSGSLGIHRGKVTATREEGRVVEVDQQKSPVARLFFADAEARMQVHLLEMGLPDALFEAMRAVPASTMRWLNADEAAELGLTGFDPGYLAERAPAVQLRYGVAANDFVRRTDGVLARCGELAAQQSAFIACYRRQLLTPQ